MPLLHVQAGSADQLQDIADALWKARKVVVITGAGISTNSGIPDFRSENGLYSMIQSQFDAAAKLGAPKPDISGTTLNERPRKRRKTSPPIEDSIEVAPETLKAPAPPMERDTIQVAEVSEINTNAHSITGDTDLSIKVDREIKDCNVEATDQVEDEVVLLSEESVLGGQHYVSNHENGRDGGDDAKEEVPEPPSISQISSKSCLHAEQLHTHQAIPPVTPTGQVSKTNLISQTLPSDSKHPEKHKLLQSLQAKCPNTSQSSGPSTPKPASNSGPQTTSSSPLSSPPPAELFDSFYQPLTEPASSSTRPSSPVSTEDEPDEKGEDEDDSEPSFSQNFLNQPSNFKRSLSTLKGKELFDASIWSDPLKTSVFYTFATNLRQKSRDASPTGCHQFIGHLSKAGKMVRCYTQNIDLLEDKVGLSTRLLLGAGSRSRFSTRVSKGAAASLSSPGTRVPSQINTQPAVISPESCPEAPAPSRHAVGGQNGPQDASPTKCQEASSQLVQEADVNDQLANSTDRGLVKESTDQNGERGAEPKHDNAILDTQPVTASSTEPEKLAPAADRGNSPDHDRGVECVFLHGSLRALRCFQCGCVTDWDDGRELQTMSGQQPPCPRCEDATNARQERGKRALGVGKLRPDIVLYGEDHPESQQISSIIQHDISLAPDMLIIMGTSLKVHGLKTVVREFAKTVHNRKDGKVIFVNYTKPAESVWADIIDFWVEMDCDSWVEDLKEKKPIIWLPPGSIEAESRNANPKRRRTLNEDVEKKEVKKSKKAEKSTAATNAAAPAKDKEEGKGKGKQIAKPEPQTDARPHVPKRPAAHRDCRQNAAYWTTKIVADLASMTGRVVSPGPPPYRAAQVIQSASLALIDTPTQNSTSLKARRGPRTKNTRSKVLEAAATSDSSMKQVPNVKEEKSRSGPSVAKMPSKRRPKSIGASGPTANDICCTQASGSFKQDADSKPGENVLAEVPVPNSWTHHEGQDIPMVAAVKNRIRKPKVFFGDTDPPSTASTRRVTPVAGNARPKSKIVPQAKKAKAIKSEPTPGPDEICGATMDIQNAGLRILPVPNPRPQRPATIPQPSSELDGSMTLAPLRPSDCHATNSQRTPFLQMALGQSEPTASASPPPDFLEPIVSPGPLDTSPQMSPNHWRKRAFSYGNALSRHFETKCRNLDFTNLRGGSAGDPAYMEYPRPVPPATQQLALVEAPPLLVGASTVPILSPPVEPLSAPDSPNRQLHRESEAAAALTQMAAYAHRQFARI
ncbi:NAD-dependent deacetylase hst3 [Gnomoniopsis smithogilvyi]|uniref:NAD-dependent deacetylase hst3 n=1 Tax=Gnomoniopsis smithogilvyi TaxID=1191159 RepID=A0A9W9CU37_9PEZI|nr:NAD-dependent deacetylase hst3 [Gnomoniopsis smithogilvyi]